MTATQSQFESDCRKLLDRYFKAHPDAAMEKQALKALRMLRSSEKPLKGKAEGWAAGILYFVATDGKRGAGIPGLLNREFERATGASMATARARAARIRELGMF